MQHPTITKESLYFLKKLKNNNNREWFTEHKEEYKQHEGDIKEFHSLVMHNLMVHDQIEKMKTFRIYRDIRFSKDKTPYKSHFAGSFTRLGAQNRGGYYIQIKPGESFLATGFWNLEKEDLYRIRKELELDTSELCEIIHKKPFKKIWGELQGESLKTAPKGFDRNHENIDLIRYKQFTFKRNFTDEQVLSTTFIDDINISFQTIRPFFDYMSEVLNTNLNGETLLA